ncbi:hypothetical protein E5163_03460 [Marinicauda algicola]|uniref:VOC domain-containing protein n=1 Tax=Marinicauda algicola TaxID=2029849 RepID=A0A4S2H3N9_9PROT|nr:hypothetical protein [Marinicauda algicola]TGY90196.1 hypothetical protein E5163_03460 [Marinicauda algicola]
MGSRFAFSKAAALAAAFLLSPACADEPQAPQDHAAPAPVTREPWVMATASVTDLDRTARFFLEIGGYREIGRGPLDPAEIAAYALPDGASGEALLLAPGESDLGLVRLIRFEDAGERLPMRPGARAWDTGCYWAVMVRAHDLDTRYREAVELGWWTETPVADLVFGQSVLKVVVFRGPDGLQVQAYERLSPPLPEAFTPFERLSRPFNMMQMTRDREAARAFIKGVLGFSPFWYGPPHTDSQPTLMPLGIPRNLTTEIPYLAGIFQPAPGEYGRLEVIEIDGLEGADYAGRCDAPNLGWLSVTYPVESAAAAIDELSARGAALAIAPYDTARAGIGEARIFAVRSPDGALVEFAETLD